MHAQNDSTSNSVHSITAVITIVLALTHCAINVLQYGLCYYVQSHTVQSMCYSMVYVIMCNHTLCNQWSLGQSLIPITILKMMIDHIRMISTMTDPYNNTKDDDWSYKNDLDNNWSL